MQDNNALITREWIVYALGGFSIGVCIIALAVISLFARQFPAKVVLIESTPTGSYSEPTTDIMVASSSTPNTIAPLPNLILEPTSDLLIVTAEAAFNHGDYQKVVEVLESKLSNLTQPYDQKQAYWYLGQAEYNLGQFQLAAGYFEKLYALDPTSTHLLALASSYDEGGNKDKALEMYLQVLATDDPGIPADVRQFVEDRINTLQVLASGATFTPLPIP